MRDNLAGGAKSARRRVQQIVHDQQEAMLVSDGHARRALLLATRLQSIAADLQDPALSRTKRVRFRKIIDDAECLAWGYREPSLLAHERVTRALERAAASKLPEPAQAALYEISQFYPERVQRIPPGELERAVATVRARARKVEAIAEVASYLGFPVTTPEAARVSTSRGRAKRRGA